MANPRKPTGVEPGAGTPDPVAELNSDNASTRHLLLKIGGLEQQVSSLCTSLDKLETAHERRLERIEEQSERRLEKIENLIKSQVTSLDTAVRTVETKASAIDTTIKVGAGAIVLLAGIIWLLFQNNVKSMVEEAVEKVAAAKPVSVTLQLPDGIAAPTPLPGKE